MEDNFEIWIKLEKIFCQVGLAQTLMVPARFLSLPHDDLVGNFSLRDIFISRSDINNYFKLSFY